MNVFLIVSSSKNLINEELKSIIKKEENIVYVDYLNNGIDFILEEASYISLFDEKKYLIVRNANIFSTSKCPEGDLEKLESYLHNPNPNTIIIFTLNGSLDERKKITKIIKEKYTLKKITNLNPKDITYKIIDILKKNQIKIDYNNANFITTSCLNNYDLVVNELEKIILYYDENSVVDTMVLNSLISKNAQDNMFKFTEAVIKKDYPIIFSIFNDLKLIKEKPEMIVGSLAREYRLAYKCQLLSNKGLNKMMIASEIGMAEWMVEKCLRNSYNYRLEEILLKLRELSDTDMAIKKGDMDKYLAIEMFLLNV